MSLLPVVHNQKNNFTVVTLHYSADPDKNTKTWVTEAKKGMPERGWLREYEIDYSVYEGKPFYEFNHYNIQANKYEPKETLYRGWDYGYHRPACLITKLNANDQWCWLKAILGHDEPIFEFGKRVRAYCLANYPGALYIDAGDPAGKSISDKGKQTSVKILESLGIFVGSRRQPVEQGAEIIRKKLLMRADGQPGLVVNPDQQLCIDGFKGGLHYPEGKEGITFSEMYEKDGYYDHIFDAARYLATEMFTVIGEQQFKNEIVDPVPRQYIMGTPVSENERDEASDIADSLYSDTTDLMGGF
jgi:hypothetical protein